MKIKNRIFPLFLLLALLLAGCGSRTVADMYRPPKRSAEYQNLQSAIDRAMAGLEYASPVAGEHQQTVQLADLTGDGKDEYLVFARGDADNPLQILIFGQVDEEQYQILDTIAFNGVAFEQVEYVEMDGKPGCELVVGRLLNDQVMRIASVYSFATQEAEQIMSTIYAKFLTCDLNANDRAELMVIRQGEAEASNAVAVLYEFNDNVLERSLEAELSESLDHIKRIRLNKLFSGEPAVYISCAVSESAIVTDIFAQRYGAFTNLAYTSNSGNSVQTLRNYFVYSNDVDEDGVLELPSLTPMLPPDGMWGNEQEYLLRWYSLDIHGREIDKFYTYHNFPGGWYMELNGSWAGRITVEQKSGYYTFYIWDEGFREANPVFSLYSFTGKDRDAQADILNRFPLYRGEKAVYAAKLETASALYGISEEYLTNSFRLIRMDWKPGET